MKATRNVVREINRAVDGPIILAGLEHRLIIKSTGTVASTRANTDGIDGVPSTAWIITNKGTVSSTGGWGINLAGAGVLINSGAITGASGGFEAGSSSKVTNKGTISGGSLFSGTGIRLGDGGSITNGQGGSISGGDAGAQIAGGPGTVINKGTISGFFISVDLLAGGAVANEGRINGGIFGGVRILNDPGSVTNKGSITSGGAFGIELDAGGSVTNNEGGSIFGAGFGIQSATGFGKVVNNGTISGGTDGLRIFSGTAAVTNRGTIDGGLAGIELNAGNITNHKGGLISGRQLGISLFNGPGAVTNDGTIRGFQEGIGLLTGVGTITNDTSGSISGEEVGVEVFSGSGTVTNAGTISGGTHSVLFDSGSTGSRLVIRPGAVFIGSADATSATDSTIELTKGTASIAGIGLDRFIGFDSLLVDDEARWALNDSNTIGTVLNNGNVEVSGELIVGAAVDPNSTGVFVLDRGSILQVAAALGQSTKMNFHVGSELVVEDFRLFGQHIGTRNYTGPLLEDFRGSEIDLKGFDTTGMQAVFSGGSGLLQLTNSTLQMATLDFGKSGLGGGTLHFASDGSGGALITCL